MRLGRGGYFLRIHVPVLCVLSSAEHRASLNQVDGNLARSHQIKLPDADTSTLQNSTVRGSGSGSGIV